ncbi:uncharacterized protein [Centruroides vittatus]|uniref:uncharacterized protein n=1 Tax=Centruroides vittatus TaxID=120091 RepID=UPI0035104205
MSALVFTSFRKTILSFNGSNVRFYTKKMRPIRIKTIKSKRDEICINSVEPSPEELKYGRGGQMVMKSGMGRILRRLGMSEKQFVDQDPLHDPDDEYQEIINQADSYYDMHIQEKKERKRIIKYKRYIRKHFREPQETNLLTVAAKEQIRYLNELDPVKWNPEVLSQSFPISLEGVKKFLRSNYLPKSEKERQRHDNSVYKNIKLLKEGSEKISAKTQKLWREGKLTIEYSRGNETLPMSDPETEIQKEITVRDYDKPGEFLSIVKPYLDLQNKQKEKDKSEQTEIIESNSKLSNNFSTKENFCKVVIPTKNSSANFSNDFYFRLHSKFTESIEIRHEQSTIKENTKSEKEHNFRNGDRKENDDIILINSRNVPKYNDDNIEYVVDSHRSQSSDKKQPYLYDSKSGYQHPLGEASDYPDKIEIPKDSCKQGELYRVGNCYYDDKGEFLYRIFT